MRTTTLFVFAFLLGIGSASYRLEKECNACIEDGTMDWVLFPNCTTGCVEAGTTITWKRMVTKSARGRNPVLSHCSEMIECEVLDGCINNPSLEENAEGWIKSKNTATTCITGYDKCPNNASDGISYGWLCGFGRCVGSLVQENVLIPREATHITLFIIPQLSVQMDGEEHISLGTRESSFNFYLDDTFVYMLTSEQASKTSNNYMPLEISIKAFADGGYHKINFTFIETAFDQDHAGTAVIDYITINKIKGLTGDSHPLPKRRCSEQCPTTFITSGDKKEACYIQCNNFMCSYSNGYCNKAEYNSGTDDSEYCYNGRHPTKISSYSVCKNFADFSCCSQEENDVVTNKFSRIISLNNKTITQKCYNQLLSLLCAPCSGSNKNYIENGKINYCNSLSSDIYDKCKGIKVPSDDSVITINSEDDVRKFITSETGGNVVSSGCYMYSDYVHPVKEKESLVLFYVGIGLLVFAVLVIIISFVVFFALKRRNLKPKEEKDSKKAAKVNDMNRSVEMDNLYSTGNYPTMYFTNTY